MERSVTDFAAASAYADAQNGAYVSVRVER
jgi:hypothetical protein